MARARSIADVTIEKFDAANARAERAERAQQTAETEAADRNETLAAACNEIETLSAQLAATETELIAARNRANEAE